jgi:hypothetical protein
MFRAMLFMKMQTEPLQSICFHCAHLVRAAHCMPEFNQKRRETAHAASGYPNKMNPVTLTRQELRQINW